MYLCRCYRQKDKRHGYSALVESYRSWRGHCSARYLPLFPDRTFTCIRPAPFHRPRGTGASLHSETFKDLFVSTLARDRRP